MCYEFVEKVVPFRVKLNVKSIKYNLAVLSIRLTHLPCFYCQPNWSLTYGDIEMLRPTLANERKLLGHQLQRHHTNQRWEGKMRKSQPKKLKFKTIKRGKTVIDVWICRTHSKGLTSEQMDTPLDLPEGEKRILQVYTYFKLQNMGA